jgi:hypothetical protein
VSWLAERGRRTVYTPDAIVAAAAEPLFGPHLRETLRRGRIRGAAARRTRGRSVSAATLLSVLPLAAGVVGLVLLAVDARAGAVLLVAAALAILASAALAAVRFQSLRVGLLAVPALVLTQAAYLGGFVRGLASGA